MVTCLHVSGPLVRWHTMAGHHGSRSVWQRQYFFMVSRKQRKDKKGPEQDMPFEVMPLVTYFLQPAPITFQ
jgi:hypothetical protein